MKKTMTSNKKVEFVWHGGFPSRELCKPFDLIIRDIVEDHKIVFMVTQTNLMYFAFRGSFPINTSLNSAL